MGALVRQEVFSGEWWRLITAGFVHIYLSHLIPNMAGLWILGKRLERLVGSFGVIAFYVGCEVVGNLAILHLHPSSGGYGSSLPITGFAGTLLLVYGVRFSTLSKRAKWKFGLLLLMAAGLVRSDIFDTHFFAHTIGLLIGAAFAVILLLCTRRRSETVADRCVPLP
jgi:rhomboid protease GluP